VRRPAIVVLVPLAGPATALLVAETAEDQERIRKAIIRRGDLVPAVAVAIAGLLEVLDKAAEGDEVS